MKIAFTICNYGAAANIGGDVERETYIVDVDEAKVPDAVKIALESMRKQTSNWQGVTITPVLN